MFIETRVVSQCQKGKRSDGVFCFLQNPESDWQKVDYLMEFGEWLFVNEYPVADALDQVTNYFSC